VAAERPLRDVFGDILSNVQEIVRSEVRLAKAELREEASKAVLQMLWVVAGTVAGVLAVLFVLWTIVYAVALVWPLWAATLVVAAVLAVVASGLLMTGVGRLKRIDVTPEQTIEAMKENVEWIRQPSK